MCRKSCSESWTLHKLFAGEGGSERDKRLRPERPKKENPDFDYEFSLVPENHVWVKKEQIPVSQQNGEKQKEGQPGQAPQVVTKLLLQYYPLFV